MPNKSSQSASQSASRACLYAAISIVVLTLLTASGLIWPLLLILILGLMLVGLVWSIGFATASIRRRDTAKVADEAVEDRVPPFGARDPWSTRS